MGEVAELAGGDDASVAGALLNAAMGRNIGCTPGDVRMDAGATIEVGDIDDESERRRR